MSELSIESAAKVDVKKMSKTERTELRRIVKRRFRMLREQLHTREYELRRALAQQIADERKKSVDKITTRMKPLIERQNKLAEAWGELYEEAEKLGVQVNLFSAASSINLPAYISRYGTPVKPTAEQDAQKLLDGIKEKAGWGKLNLNEMEWRLDEQLAVGEIESESASEFLSALPTVETLLPLPKGVELLELEEPIV